MNRIENQKRGKRNRQRGAELQREIVNMARSLGLEAHNRDRGGAQHEMGDVEIADHFFGCKRKRNIASYLKPEKQEAGVFTREDRGQPYVVIPAFWFLKLLHYASQAKGEESCV